MEREEEIPESEQGDSEIVNIKDGEHIQASLKVRHGGKQPMAELEVKVVVTLNKISKVPELVAGTMDTIYERASEKGYLL